MSWDPETKSEESDFNTEDTWRPADGENGTMMREYGLRSGMRAQLF